MTPSRSIHQREPIPALRWRIRIELFQQGQQILRAVTIQRTSSQTNFEVATVVEGKTCSELVLQLRKAHCLRLPEYNVSPATDGKNFVSLKPAREGNVDTFTSFAISLT